MPGADVTASNITVSFDGTTVLHDVSMHADAGEVVALLGASGSGKSTLLRVIAGLLSPDAGRVDIGGDDMTSVPTHRRNVGMVFQDNQLFPHRTTFENVEFGLKLAGVNRHDRRERAQRWLDLVGLDGFGPRRVTELSGGEAKRVALARTLVVEPPVVLLDEPLTGLDRELHDQLVDELATLLHDTASTAILVTHDVEEAAALADRTLRLSELHA
ncbi:MAG: ABC transporter ATP-binding protein [Ilumatobacter sp.]|uniref:ABC transporter ATP-binding protein n=1 Tax=Ilumatobacter sp. TaxID=1967498 RepID=UPI003C715B30